MALSNPFTDGSLDSTDEKEILEEGEPKGDQKEIKGSQNVCIRKGSGQGAALRTSIGGSKEENERCSS